MAIKWSYLSVEQIDYYRTMGNLYGYPECCIESFLDAVNEIEVTGECKSRTELQYKYSMHGFVPCKIHAYNMHYHTTGYAAGSVEHRKFVSARMAADINSHRQFPYPFPIDLQTIKELRDAIINPIKKQAEEPVQFEHDNFPSDFYSNKDSEVPGGIPLEL